MFALKYGVLTFHLYNKSFVICRSSVYVIRATHNKHILVLHIILTGLEILWVLTNFSLLIRTLINAQVCGNNSVVSPGP